MTLIEFAAMLRQHGLAANVTSFAVKDGVEIAVQIVSGGQPVQHLFGAIRPDDPESEQQFYGEVSRVIQKFGF